MQVDNGPYDQGKGILEWGTWCWLEGAYFSETPDEIDPDRGHYGYPCEDDGVPGLHTVAAVVHPEGTPLMEDAA